MKRGEVWLVDFGGTLVAEQGRHQKGLIVSNDPANKHLDRVQVLPVADKLSPCYPSETVVSLGNRQGKAKADQIMSVLKSRLSTHTATVTDDDMLKVEHAISVHLGFLSNIG